MEKNNILLIQVWLGKIPDYFWFHYETTKDIIGFDFILFTDQDIKLDSKKMICNGGEKSPPFLFGSLA